MSEPVQTFAMDTGALIALERADPLMTGILARVRAGRARLVIAEAVVAQVWRGGTGRQARLGALLGLKSDQCTAVPLDREAAKAIGRTIGTYGHTDVVDVHVAILALHHNAVVVTSDRDDVTRVAPELAGRILDV